MLAGLPTGVGNSILRGIRKYDYQATATEWPGPILLIRGAQDRTVNRQLPATLTALSTKGNFHLVDRPDAGHFVNLDQPRQFRAAIA